MKREIIHTATGPRIADEETDFARIENVTTDEKQMLRCPEIVTAEMAQRREKNRATTQGKRFNHAEINHV